MPDNDPQRDKMPTDDVVEHGGEPVLLPAELPEHVR